MHNVWWLINSQNTWQWSCFKYSSEIIRQTLYPCLMNTEWYDIHRRLITYATEAFATFGRDDKTDRMSLCKALSMYKQCTPMDCVINWQNPCQWSYCKHSSEIIGQTLYPCLMNTEWYSQKTDHLLNWMPLKHSAEMIRQCPYLKHCQCADNVWWSSV